MGFYWFARSCSQCSLLWYALVRLDVRIVRTPMDELSFRYNADQTKDCVLGNDNGKLTIM